ncbi:hypothetical protein FBEOM_10730 [Fusarium beomiforme]|uniref:CBM-cenC domain-containing protein n=1 Tax=Fusarium beomiforme TaxID=44412 RepID=A0A9P5AAS1_9HYPO|nr:hypothetical protein FBEOM_10730 [Fusarium beomiforme]
MASQRLFAAFAALSVLVGSEASPCKPISSTTQIEATSTFSSEFETATASDATFTTGFTSTETDYATEITITDSETKVSSAAESTTTLAVSTTQPASTTTSAAPIEVPTILVNGDFETGDIAPWFNFGIGAFANIVTDEVSQGTYSLKIGSQASDWSNVVQVLRKSTLVANQPYSLSIYAKVSSGSKCTAVEAFIDNNDLNDSFGTRIRAAGAQLSNGFVGLSGDFYLTQAALDSNNAIRIVIRASCSNGYVAYVDNVQLGISD